MSTNLRPSFPPLQVPMVDEKNMVTREWADFFEAIYRYEKVIAESVADGTYKLGLNGGGDDGEITITTGIITAIQEVS